MVPSSSQVVGRAPESLAQAPEERRGGPLRGAWARPAAAPAPAAPAPAGPVEPLTAREREVLARLGEGLSNKEIAAALRVSPETVKRHAATIYAKLGANNRRSAVTRAEELDLLSRARNRP